MVNILSFVFNVSNPQCFQSTPELLLTRGAAAKSANQRAAFSADSVKVQQGENKGKAASDSAQHMIP